MLFSGYNQRTLAKRYIQDLKYTSVQKVLAPILTRGRFEESRLAKGLISFFLRFTKIESRETILAKVLCLGLEGQEEHRDYFLKKIQSNNLQAFFIQPVRDYFNTTLEELNQKTLVELQNRLKYNLITYPLDEKPDDPYKNLKIKDGVTLSMLRTLSDSALNNSKLADQFHQLLEFPESPIKEETLLKLYGVDAEYGFLTGTMKWRILASGIHQVDFNPLSALQLFERVALYGKNGLQLSTAIRFLIYVANINRELNEISGFIYDSPDEYIEKYVGHFYRIDQNYRNAIDSYRLIDISELPTFIGLEPLKELLEDRYESYLEKLNREWLKCFYEHGFEYKEINVPKQYEFLKRDVLPFDQKIVVIISDALRYESAMSLLSELHGDNKNEAEMTHQLASIPSTTQYGMANLLASDAIHLKGQELFIKDICTDGLANRAKILKTYLPDAQAFAYADIEGNSQKENREIFKSSLVYIYHDCIDAIGDKRVSERNTFKAVADGIAELKTMVKKLHSSYAVARVIITADHGFIYNDRTIKEADKEPLNEAETIQTHNRYTILKNGKKQDLGYKIPLRQTTPIDSDLFVLVPKSVNRYKKQGVGHQFVHGGASLQELVVPIIESTRKRADVIKKVTPVLISKNLRVVSNILRIQILQEQRVSKIEKKREILVGLYRDLELVSNQVAIRLNSTSELPSERNFGCELMLRGDTGNVSLLKLKIYDKDDELNPLIVREVINNTLIELDF